MQLHVVAAGDDHAVALGQQAQPEQVAQGAARGFAGALAGAVEVDREHVAHQGHAPAGAIVAGQAVDRHLGPEARQEAGRAAGFGQRDDAAHVDVFGQEHAGHGDGLVGAFEPALRLLEVGVVVELALGAKADAHHGLDRLHRVAARGRFGREHHRVGAVDDRVGHVQHLGAGRDRVVDHRLQHLGGGDDDAVVLERGADDLLLQAGQFGVADLHAQVAARHHHHVRGAGDFNEVFDGLGAFDLGDQEGVGAGGLRQRAGLVHVGRGAAEGHGQEVHAQASSNRDVLLVLVGERAQRQAAAEAVEALAVGQRAVGEHAGADAVAFDRQHFDRHQAVVEQQRVARMHVVDQAQVADADLAGVTRRRVGTAQQVELVAGDQRHLATGELFDADLRALQVGQDADFAALFGRGFAHRRHPRRVLFGRAVGEVQAHHVDAGAHQAGKHARCVGGRAEGGEDLGAAKWRGHGGFWRF